MYVGHHIKENIKPIINKIKIMKKVNYSSPSCVLIQFNSEQAIFAASNMIMLGAESIDNEEFVPGGTFSDWV